jgi:hypothetical protein
MKLKPSLKNSAKVALLFSLILSLLFCGCGNQLEPTYKDRDIPSVIQKICKEEYGLSVTTRRTHTTLWVYAPLDKILHKDYDGIKQDKIFDEEMSEKLRNILTTIGRVLISSNNTPDFFALLVSDINIGIDYIIIGSTIDIKKSYASFIPWTEANRRYVMQFRLSPEAIGDKTGEHLRATDISLPNFLAMQIGQRIALLIQQDTFSKYFKIKKIDGKFNDGIFSFDYDIEQIATPIKPIDLKKEMLKTIAYCIRTYDFQDFSDVEINDLAMNDKSIFSKAAIWSKPTE